MNRRRFLTGAGAATAAGLSLNMARRADESSQRAEVFIARADSYSVDLETVIRQGLEVLVLGRATVKTHVSNVLAKLHLRDRVQAVVLAHEAGLIRPEADRANPSAG